MTLGVLVIEKIPNEKIVLDVYMINDGHSMALAPLEIWYSNPPKVITAPIFFFS